MFGFSACYFYLKPVNALTTFGPLFITTLLLFVSGVPLAEKKYGYSLSGIIM